MTKELHPLMQDLVLAVANSKAGQFIKMFAQIDETIYDE